VPLSGWTTTRMLAAVQQMYSRCTATAANKRSAGAGRIPGTKVRILVLIDLCMYMYSRMRERRAWTTNLRVAAGVPVVSALLPTFRQIPCIVVEMQIPSSIRLPSLAAVAANAATGQPRGLCCPLGRKGRARARVCGRRPTSSVKWSGGLYLCYDCLKKAKRPAKVQPLPGVLDHRAFKRVKVEIGRCTARGRGRRRCVRNDCP